MDKITKNIINNFGERIFLRRQFGNHVSRRRHFDIVNWTRFSAIRQFINPGTNIYIGANIRRTLGTLARGEESRWQFSRGEDSRLLGEIYERLFPHITNPYYSPNIMRTFGTVSRGKDSRVENSGGVDSRGVDSRGEDSREVDSRGVDSREEDLRREDYSPRRGIYKRPLPGETNPYIIFNRRTFSTLSCVGDPRGGDSRGGHSGGGHSRGGDSVPTGGIYKCPFPDIQLPEIDLAAYMLDEMRKYSKDVALVDSETGQPIRYDQLIRHIRALARTFRKMNVIKDDVIAVCAHNCIEYVSVILAANLIGAAYSPVNPVYTSEEISRAINLTNAKVLVATKSCQQVCNEAQINCPSLKFKISINNTAIGWHNYNDLISTNEVEDLNFQFDSKNDVASIPFSSGTTGAAKGIQLTHYNLVSNIIQLRQNTVMGYAREDVLLAVLPFFHIYGNIVVLMAGLAAGTKIVVMPSFHPVAYFQNIADYKCTFLHIVPPILLLFNKHPLAKNLDLGRVRAVFTGAAPASQHELEQFSRKLTLPGAAVRQGYGLTETSPLTHSNPPQLNKWNTIGIGVHNTQYKFVSMPTDDAKGAEDVMVLHVKGPQVMRGYLNNPDATKEILTDDGWLNTGDVGYADEDGYVIISDRLKEMIKVRGFQVAPAELESLLLKHPAVSDVAVVGCKDEESGERPVAFVVAKDGCQVLENDVMNYVLKHAAPFKRLAKVYFVDSIPKSASGKILRRVLKKQL